LGKVDGVVDTDGREGVLEPIDGPDESCVHGGAMERTKGCEIEKKQEAKTKVVCSYWLGGKGEGAER
jgi:hypothetical protein